MKITNTYIVFVVFIITILVFIVFIVIYFLLYNKRHVNYLREKYERESEYKQELLQSQLEIQEQTLKNISQEIHDNVGQVLSLAKLNLNMMDIEKPEQLKGKIDNTLAQVTKAINDLRDLSKSFNTDNITSMGLIRAISYELDIISKTDSHKTEFRINGNSRRLEPQKELILFRIVQEALHNIIKHAGAKKVKVKAEYADHHLELCVCDDGNGFDLTPLHQTGNDNFGLGIRNMHNRARLIGADFSMSSTQGEGTIVKIILPLKDQAPDQ